MHKSGSGMFSIDQSSFNIAIIFALISTMTLNHNVMMYFQFTNQENVAQS